MVKVAVAEASRVKREVSLPAVHSPLLAAPRRSCYSVCRRAGARLFATRLAPSLRVADCSMPPAFPFDRANLFVPADIHPLTFAESGMRIGRESRVTRLMQRGNR